MQYIYIYILTTEGVGGWCTGYYYYYALPRKKAEQNELSTPGWVSQPLGRTSEGRQVHDMKHGRSVHVKYVRYTNEKASTLGEKMILPRSPRKTKIKKVIVIVLIVFIIVIFAFTMSFNDHRSQLINMNLPRKTPKRSHLEESHVPTALIPLLSRTFIDARCTVRLQR